MNGVGFAVTHERLADTFAVQHAASHDHPTDRSVGILAQQHPDFFDIAEAVDANGHRIDIHDRHPAPDKFELVIGQPLLIGLCVDLTHAPDDPTPHQCT